MKRWLCLILILFASIAALGAAPAAAHLQPEATPTPTVIAPADLIVMINRIRTGRGLPALIVDPILMGTAQSTAEIMAAYRMTGHIGDVRGRVMAAGYGAGDIPWATENFAVLPMRAGASYILQVWADDLHMKPMADPNYKHIGAGISVVSEEAVYYIVHAGYTSNRIYKPGATAAPGTAVAGIGADPFSQYIFAVQTATPRPDGELIHIVKQGQSLWSIAIAYQTHIDILQRMNGMARENLTLYTGQKLRVPTAQCTVEIKEVAAATAAALSKESAAAEGTMVSAVSIETAVSEETVGSSETEVHPSPASPQDEVEAAPPAPAPPSIPATGASLDQTILTILIALGLVGVGLVLFGIAAKRF